MSPQSATRVRVAPAGQDGAAVPAAEELVQHRSWRDGPVVRQGDSVLRERMGVREHREPLGRPAKMHQLRHGGCAFGGEARIAGARSMLRYSSSCSRCGCAASGRSQESPSHRRAGLTCRRTGRLRRCRSARSGWWAPVMRSRSNGICSCLSGCNAAAATADRITRVGDFPICVLSPSARSTANGSATLRAARHHPRASLHTSPASTATSARSTASPSTCASGPPSPPTAANRCTGGRVRHHRPLPRADDARIIAPRAT